MFLHDCINRFWITRSLPYVQNLILQMWCKISQTNVAACYCNFEGRNTITSSHYRVSSNLTK